METLKKSIDEAIFKSWWVILFCLLCYMSLERGQISVRASKSLLSERLQDLKKEKEHASEMQKKLKLQISSQQDPAWIELILMKNLGLVPDGQTKVYFIESF